MEEIYLPQQKGDHLFLNLYQKIHIKTITYLNG